MPSYLVNMAKFQFYCCLDGSDKTTIPMIKRVRKINEETWFGFPEELQKASAHSDLLKLPIVKNAFASMKSRGTFRNLTVTLPAELQKLYTDDDGNFVCGDFVLGEDRVSSHIPPTSDPSEGTRFDAMVSCLEKIAAPKEESIKEILKHLLIEKFTAKSKNVEAWCSRFEKESARFKLAGRKQIEVFKSCLDPSLNNWFVVTQENLPLDAEWLDWKAEMVSNFGDNSFKPICSAIGYRYLGGSYIDYAVNKEKMLIEANGDLPKKVLLELIVYGLPAHIIRSLNRNTITSIKILKEKLKKYEEEKNLESSKSKNFNKVNIKNSSPSSSRTFENKNFNKGNNVNAGKRNNQNFNKKPCSICLAKGAERFHPESNCWYKDKPSVNNVEAESSSTSSDEETSKN